MCTTYQYVNSLMISKSDVEGVPCICSTFVCPTEIIAFSDRVEEFRSINCEVVACSTDSVFSHLAWWVQHLLSKLFYCQCLQCHERIDEHTVLLRYLKWVNSFISISRSTFILLLLITVWKNFSFLCKGEWTVHLIILWCYQIIHLFFLQILLLKICLLCF